MFANKTAFACIEKENITFYMPNENVSSTRIHLNKQYTQALLYVCYCLPDLLLYVEPLTLKYMSVIYHLRLSLMFFVEQS